MKTITITIKEQPPCEFESLKELEHAAQRIKDEEDRLRKENPELHQWPFFQCAARKEGQQSI